jgi:hypothetical protein
VFLKSNMAVVKFIAVIVRPFGLSKMIRHTVSSAVRERKTHR